MIIESPSFTEATYHDVVGAYFERERGELIARLRRVAEDTDALVPEVEGPVRSAEGSWNALETLAHMAISAQFFGWAIQEAAQGHEVGAEMLDLMKLRDPAIVDALDRSPAELAGEVREGLERTIGFLEAVPYDDLRTSIAFCGRRLSAEDFTRISLAHHLEDHLEQMREALERSAAALSPSRR
jgi:DinB family protein